MDPCVEQYFFHGFFMFVERSPEPSVRKSFTAHVFCGAFHDRIGNAYILSRIIRNQSTAERTFLAPIRLVNLDFSFPDFLNPAFRTVRNLTFDIDFGVRIETVEWKVQREEKGLNVLFFSKR